MSAYVALVGTFGMPSWDRRNPPPSEHNFSAVKFSARRFTIYVPLPLRSPTMTSSMYLQHHGQQQQSSLHRSGVSSLNLSSLSLSSQSSSNSTSTTSLAAPSSSLSRGFGSMQSSRQAHMNLSSLMTPSSTVHQSAALRCIGHSIETDGMDVDNWGYFVDTPDDDFTF